MAESNQMMSVEGQLVGLPLAGPESFSQQQLEYLKRALDLDETVLYEDATGALDSIPLNETLSNFERVMFVWKDWSSTSCKNVQYFMADSENFMLTGTWAGGTTNITIWSICMTPNSTKTTLTKTFAHFVSTNKVTTLNNSDNSRILKVVGIHRIAGGN